MREWEKRKPTRDRTKAQVLAGLKCYQRMGELDKEFTCRMELCPYWSEDVDTGTSICNVPLIIDDAIEIIENKARLLSIDEVRALQPGDSFWMEWWIVTNEKGDTETEVDMYVITPDGIAHEEGSYQYLDRFEFMQQPDYKTRAWSAEPTDAQREATAWP